MPEQTSQMIMSPPQLPTSEELKSRRQPLHDLLQKTLFDLSGSARAETNRHGGASSTLYVKQSGAGNTG